MHSLGKVGLSVPMITTGPQPLRTDSEITSSIRSPRSHPRWGIQSLAGPNSPASRSRASVGVYATMTCSAAIRAFPRLSLAKQYARFAACCGLSGGQRRVFTDPARGSFNITMTAGRNRSDIRDDFRVTQLSVRQTGGSEERVDARGL